VTRKAKVNHHRSMRPTPSGLGDEDVLELEVTVADIFLLCE